MTDGYRARALTEADAAQIAGWRYAPPYELHDSAPADATRELLAATAAYYADPIHRYFAVDGEAGVFLGFGCFGVEAQVRGYDYTQTNALEIGFGMRPDVYAIIQPTLVIRGDADAPVPAASSQLLADSLPNATLIVLPGAGHIPTLTRPAEVAQAMADDGRRWQAMADFIEQIETAQPD